MKKLALLLSVALLAACGGSGSSTTKSTVTSGGQDTGSTYAQTGPSRAVTFSLVAPKSSSRFAPTVSTSLKRVARIVITNPSLNASNSNIFQRYAEYDYDAAAPPIEFTLPVANGYLVEGFVYSVNRTSYSSYSSATWNFKQEGYSSAYNIGYRGYSASYRIVGARETLAAQRNILFYGSYLLDIPATGAIGNGTIFIDPPGNPNNAFLFTQSPGDVPSEIYKYGFNNMSTGKYRLFANITGATATASGLNRSSYGVKLAESLAGLDQVNTYSNVSGSFSSYLLGPYAQTNGVKTYYARFAYYAKDSLAIRALNETPSMFIFNSPNISAPVVINSRTISWP